ncbi:MAG: hypothetical protein WC568_09580 [Candidatus Methanoperedens sp.]
MENNQNTLENFSERKLKNLFQDSGNPLVVEVGDLIRKKATIEEIVHAAKIAVEQRQIDNEEL